MSTSSLEELFGVRGLVAVITGGGTGLGLMAAKALDAHGAKAVYIVGRRKEKLESAAAEAKNGSIIPLEGDTSDHDSLQAMADTVKKEHGYLNVVFANAGVQGPSFDELPQDRHPSVKEFRDAAFSASSAEQYGRAFDVNVSGVFFTALAFLELLDAGNKQSNLTQKSQVLVTASIGGFLRIPQDGWAYQPSKAAVIHLVKMMSTHFAPWNIRANAIAPGLYPSELTEELLKPLTGDKHMTEEGALPAEMVPLQRSGREEDFAGLFLFLTSKAGGYVNGDTLVSDGGRLGQVPSTY